MQAMTCAGPAKTSNNQLFQLQAGSADLRCQRPFSLTFIIQTAPGRRAASSRAYIPAAKYRLTRFSHTDRATEVEPVLRRSHATDPSERPSPRASSAGRGPLVAARYVACPMLICTVFTIRAAAGLGEQVIWTFLGSRQQVN